MVLSAGGLAFEVIETLFDHAAESVTIDLKVMSRDNGFIDLLQQQLVSNRFGERSVVLLQKAAFARDGLDYALAFQFSVRLGDGISVHAQLLGQWTNGRQWFTGTQPARRRGVTHLIDQLQINRFARLEIDLKQHNCQLTYGT